MVFPEPHETTPKNSEKYICWWEKCIAGVTKNVTFSVTTEQDSQESSHP